VTEPEDRGELSPDERRAMASTLESYQEIPYRTQAWASSRPSHLETIARLWGLEPSPVASCRVLELGCGDGGNLIPMALAHPESECLGVDLAKGHIDAGRALAERLGVRNVRLQAASFIDLDEPLGPFDYIIVHGLMSWVTPFLQQQLFATCRRLLAPQGVAMITYNTYPGWHLRGGLRDILLHYNRGVDDTRERLRRARELLAYLRDAVPKREAGYREHVEAVESIASNPEREYYFAHEYLEDANHPFYFRDFVERAAREGLQYVADTEHVDTEIEGVSPDLETRAQGLAEDRIELLQLLDFARNRKFRQSLLCRGDAPLWAEPDVHRVEKMYLASFLKPVENNADVASEAPLTFKSPNGRGIEADEPLLKAALIRFSEQSIQPIAFDASVEWAYRRLGATPPADPGQRAEDRAGLCRILCQLFLLDMVELSASPPCWALEVSDRPEASPLVRLDAAQRRPTTSLRHRRLALDNERVCQVLVLLDGSRDRRALLSELGEGFPAEELDKILDLSMRNAVLMPERERGRC
jgi:SAM-dependent methyltransferase